ncbi:GntR family transcriptional regulator [Plantactinospora sonchi]|uniref:GntR family transcriptional regulator n=1 Tax=Plantactinospora sonchi TaxID=1544735 RepID=A0ABU7RYV5_9ACTN
MQPGDRIDRGSPLPMYYQLKHLLVRDIERRRLQPGDRILGDHELCARYGVSRTVVRQALTDLENEGVIERVKGRGTFVAHPKTAEGLVQSLTGLFEDVAARGGHLRSEVRRAEVVPADAAVAADLGIDPGEPVIHLERLRFVDNEPWVWTVTHLPAALAPGLVEEDLTDRSLYQVLESTYGVRLVRGIRSVEAAVANTGQARLLGIRRGDPLLVLRSVSIGDSGRPVESFLALHRGDRSRFQVELNRAAGSGRAGSPLVLVTS